jgi:hypothetical protein
VYGNDWANSELVKPTKSKCSRVLTCPPPAPV